MMSNKLAIYYFMKCEYQKDPENFLSAKDISREFELSLDRTRRHLSLLVFDGKLETHVDGWCNVYRVRC